MAKRFEDLIRQVGQWRQANEIRAYVKAIRHAPGRWAPAVSMDQRLGAVPTIGSAQATDLMGGETQEVSRFDHEQLAAVQGL